MASAISETSTYEASVVGPDDGDTQNAASVRTGMQDLANRTKFLNDNKASLSGATFTGLLGTSAANGATLKGTTILLGPLMPEESGTDVGQISSPSLALTDADATLFASAGNLKYASFRVPTLTANRVYTFSATNVPATGVRKRVRVVRMRTADAFTVTVRRSDTTVIGVISASAAGWIDFEYNSSNWVVAGFGGTVTSLHTGE